MSNFHDEWYRHPIVERFAYGIVQLMKLISSPYVMPFWIFALAYFVGKMSLIYCVIISVATFVIGYKVWVSSEKETKPKQKKDKLEQDNAT